MATLQRPLLVRITCVKSALHAKPNVRKTMEALGLHRTQQSIIHKNILPVRGMINIVKNHVAVEPIFWIPKHMRKPAAQEPSPAVEEN